MKPDGRKWFSGNLEGRNARGIVDVAVENTYVGERTNRGTHVAWRVLNNDNNKKRKMQNQSLRDRGCYGVAFRRVLLT